MIGEAAVVAGSLRINAPAGAVVSLHGLVFEAAGIGGTAVILSARAALHAQSCVIKNFAEPGANGIQPQPLPIGSSAVSGDEQHNCGCNFVCRGDEHAAPSRRPRV